MRVYTAVYTARLRAVWERVHGPIGLPAMYTTGRVRGRVRGPYTRTFTEPCTGRVHGPCIRLCIGRVYGAYTAL